MGANGVASVSGSSKVPFHEAVERVQALETTPQIGGSVSRPAKETPVLYESRLEFEVIVFQLSVVGRLSLHTALQNSNYQHVNLTHFFLNTPSLPAGEARRPRNRVPLNTHQTAS